MSAKFCTKSKSFRFITSTSQKIHSPKTSTSQNGNSLNVYFPFHPLSQKKKMSRSKNVIDFWARTGSTYSAPSRISFLHINVTTRQKLVCLTTITPELFKNASAFSYSHHSSKFEDRLHSPTPTGPAWWIMDLWPTLPHFPLLRRGRHVLALERL